MEEIITTITELLAAKKIAELRSFFAETEPADIAAALKEFDDEKLPVLYRILPKDVAADVFVEMDGDEQEYLIKSFSDRELREVVNELYLDDAVDIIEEMPATVVKRILANTNADNRKIINELLNYPKDSAGSIMTTEYVDLKSDMTVGQAFARIRRTGVDKETVYTCYVTDYKRKLLGIATVKEMILSGEDAKIEDIMDTNIIFCTTTEDKEDVAEKIKKYDFLALPVVDKEDRLVGIVTVDDAIDVMVDEATEDIEKMAAVLPTEKAYLKTSVFSIWKARAPWQLLLMISATFTGMILNNFEDKMTAFPALIAFIPMLMDTGGNTGSQAAVTVIRALSLGELQFRDLVKVIWKEIRVAVLCGAMLALACFIKIQLIDVLIMGSSISLLSSAVVCITMLVTVFCAKLVGCTLPILSDRIGLDPAVMSSPFITTIVDAISLLIYFNIASLLLKL